MVKKTTSVFHTTPRLGYVDIAKGLGMLMVIWGHINGGKTNVFVYSFHMPLFFFLSGMVYRGEKYDTFIDFAARKIKTLVIPYLMEPVNKSL